MDNDIITNTAEESKEEKSLRKKARRRVNMRVHFTIFILVNLVLWLLYFFLFKESSLGDGMLKFCLGLTLIWAVIVYAHYLIVFKWGNSSVDKEVKKLRKQEAKETAAANEENNNNE